MSYPPQGAAGIGDMTKATYDPDDDGVIAVAQTEADKTPSGFIAMWHGLIANIPSGYVICDGNNSTPNLLARFVQGVATAATNPGATGGKAAHTLTLSELPGPGVGSIVSWVGSGGDYDVTAGGMMILGGGSQAHENEPPYYDVAFLMKT